ncbi:MAG: hypothetical protein LAQ30_12880 [Acidobacteriia bacterium]|nr:hypothetical protein [Terriglobia bacterium]
MPKNLLVVMLLPLVCVAEDLPKLPPETMGLIDQARGAPPEFSADTLLKLAASPLVTEPKWKLELADEAFASGGRAQLPCTYSCLVPVDVIQCQEREGRGLDALALQTRAVEAVLPLNPQRAVEMFLSIVPPKVEGVACADPVIPDVSAYYSTANKLFERGFTAAQRKKGDDLRFLETCIASMTSPAHVRPVLEMLSAAKLPPQDRTALLSRFAVTLETVSGSDRIFATTQWAVVPAAFPETPEPMHLPRPFLPEIPDANLFVPALRSYVVRQASGSRCSDNITKDKLPLSVTNFNALAAKLDPEGARFKPITAEEAKLGKDEGTYKYQLPWHSARAQKVLAEEKWLLHGNRNLPDAQRFWTLEERTTPEWNARALDFMKLIEGWAEDEESSPEEHFWLVAQAYSNLAQLTPPGRARDSAMGRYLNFLETRYTSVHSRVLWFVWVRDMLGRPARSNDAAKDATEREWVLNSLLRSANPVIALYARLAPRN